MSEIVKIMQFGEGVFLRGFWEPMIEQMNRESDFHAEVYAVKPRKGAVPQAYARQNCRYHLLLRGVDQNGETIENLEDITCLKALYSSSAQWDKVEELARDPRLKIIVSNTTEAGIVYEKNNPDTFPGKLAKLLQIRAAAKLPGVAIFPCELIVKNGDRLREYVLRYLSNDPAADYVRNECRFYNTLVDRIVSGFPADAASFDPDDQLMVAADPFSFLAVEAEESLRQTIPFPEDSVLLTSDITPYRLRKIRGLNASHTAMVPAGILAGFSEVKELMDDPRFRKRIETTLFDEILPTIPLPEVEKLEFAKAVIRRFCNPFTHHKLEAIALNCVAKWKERILPILLESKDLPYYLSGTAGELYCFLQKSNAIFDEPEVAAKFANPYSLDDFLGDTALWGMDLRTIPGLQQAAAFCYDKIEQKMIK